MRRVLILFSAITLISLLAQQAARQYGLHALGIDFRFAALPPSTLRSHDFWPRRMPAGFISAMIGDARGLYTMRAFRAPRRLAKSRSRPGCRRQLLGRRHRLTR